MRYERHSKRFRHGPRYERHTNNPPAHVTDAEIHTATASPAPNNAPVQFNISVHVKGHPELIAPLGDWSISSGGNIAAITDTQDDHITVAPTGGDTFGNITIKWKSKDWFGAETTKDFRFEKVAINA